MPVLSRRSALALGLAFASALSSAAQAAPSEIRIDWATYNPVSIVLKQNGTLESALAADGVTVRWVQSAGSNKALEFLNAGSIDFGSTAGAAALIARVNGNPIKSIYVYSRPEWTALVTRPEAGVASVADLKGKRIAVTRGTDPHIFLVRALAKQGLTDKDVKLVLLQHADGRLALQRGDVDAWAGLDPMMASAELSDGAKLFFRDAAANTWGVLNVREEFAAQNPALVEKVLAAYEEARKWALAHPAELRALLAQAAKIPDEVAARQLERTELTHGPIGEAQAETIAAAGRALAETGVLPRDVDVDKAVGSLIEPRYAAKLTN